MGRVALSLYKRKLANLLEITADDELAWLIWCVTTLQSANPERAAGMIKFPPEAITRDYGSRYFAHPWRLETILNEALTTPKLKSEKGYQRKFLCASFDAIAILMNAVNKVEDHESGISLRYLDIMNELHRLGQRQFEWQRGFANIVAIYRSAYIFGGPLARARFLQRRKIDLDDFSKCCFVLMSSWYSRPFLPSGIDLSIAGIRSEIVSATFSIISISNEKARETAKNIRSIENQIAYKPSILRQYPVIRFGEHEEHAICPLPALLASRASSGLYYDLVGGSGDVTNEISGNFENYCLDLLREIVGDDQVERGANYTYRGNDYQSMDIGLRYENELAVIFECKATKLTYAAKFAEFPIEQAQEKYAEIIKGVFQIWRYVSHVRRGLAPPREMSEYPVGVVLTLDAWLMMSTSMQKDIIARAEKFSVNRDPDISASDRIPVIFCPIDDLELVCSKCSHASLINTLRGASREEFYGWMLDSIHQQIHPDEQDRRPYPFFDRIADVAPWWAEMQNIMQRGRGTA